MGKAKWQRDLPRISSTRCLREGRGDNEASTGLVESCLRSNEPLRFPFLTSSGHHLSILHSPQQKARKSMDWEIAVTIENVSIILKTGLSKTVYIVNAEIPIFFSHLDSLKCWQARRILEEPTCGNLTSQRKKKKKHQKILTKEVSPQRNCLSRSPCGRRRGGNNFSGS